MKAWIWFVLGIGVGGIITLAAIAGIVVLLVYWKHEDDPSWGVSD